MTRCAEEYWEQLRGLLGGPETGGFQMTTMLVVWLVGLVILIARALRR